MGDWGKQPGRKIRILVVDDHPVVRKGIRHMVTEEPDMVVAAEAADSQESFGHLDQQTFDVITLDLSLRNESGFDLLEALKARRLNIPVLVVSMHSEEHAAIRALKAGAAGYLCKDSMAETLISAIRKIVGGGRFITPTLAEQLAGHLSEDAHPLHQRLSPREFRVMCLLAMGEPLKHIGELLSVSIKTVSTYKSRIFQKMSFQSNAELVKYVVRHRLSEGEETPINK